MNTYKMISKLSQDELDDLERYKEAVSHRLTGSRLDHSIGTSNTAGVLAKVYGVDEFLARAAGYLHDWDKVLTNDELLASALEFDIKVTDDPNEIMPLLHARTAAFRLLDVFPELPDEVFVAIARHTTGALDMSRLDMVVYVADMIEPTRGDDEWHCKLRLSVGEVPLEELYTACYCHSLIHLLEMRRFIYPKALSIWNSLIENPNVSRSNSPFSHLTASYELPFSKESNKRSVSKNEGVKRNLKRAATKSKGKVKGMKKSKSKGKS